MTIILPILVKFRSLIFIYVPLPSHFLNPVFLSISLYTWNPTSDGVIILFQQSIMIEKIHEKDNLLYLSLFWHIYFPLFIF